MTRREVARLVLEGKTPPYVPWNFGFTLEAEKKLKNRPADDLDGIFAGHFAGIGNPNGGPFEDLANGRVRDPFGVLWNRTVDKDIGIVEGQVLAKPTLDGYRFPDPVSPAVFNGIDQSIERHADKFQIFNIGFSLYERAWTLRGMESLMMDFIEHPQFVHDLLDVIADYNVAQVREALKYDIDAVNYGDDWGQQTGLQMGPTFWREFIKPRLKRMYGVVRDAGKFVMIHSCGDVDELFDDLVEIGLNCFNPFQPEVMNVDELLPAYRGRLSFYGGLSTQKTLPFGTPDDVIAETRHLLELGREGGYILSPAHAVEGDVPLENMLAFARTVAEQPGFKAVAG